MGAVFAEYHFERFHSDSIDVGCIDPAHSVQRLPYRLLPAFFDHVGLVGILQRRRGLSPLLFPFHVPEFPQDLLLIGGDPLLHRVVHLQSLLQAEQVILPPVPSQLFGNFLFGFAAAWVAQSVVYPPAALVNLALPTPRAVQSRTPRCSPSPPTLPVALSATPPCVLVPASSPRSWRFLDRSHPRSERIPSASRSPDRSRPRSVESPAIPGAVFACLPSSRSRVFLSSLDPTLLSTPAQAGRLWILI